MKMLFKDFGRPVISLELYINEEKRIIHVMDMSHDPTALSQTLDESLESRILNRLGESDEPTDWTWLYYHLDGFVTEYRDGTVNVYHDDPRLHDQFRAVIQKRLAAWTGTKEKHVL